MRKFLALLFWVGCILFLHVYSARMLKAPAFDKNLSYQYLEHQCNLGPRSPGSEGHDACLQFLLEKLEPSANTVMTQPFPFVNPKTKQAMALTNVIAHFGPQDTHDILFCAHWDTRPWADQDSNPANHSKPILGANDGASGVAVLLVIAKILGENPPEKGIDIVFFDGEDSGLNGQDETWCQGSRYFARNLPKDNYPQYAILLDFVGDKDLRFPVEGFSKRYASDIVDLIWNKAAELGYEVFDPTLSSAIVDDHLELLKVGIPAVDIIDFDYPYYHTLQDTPDKCSPESLDIVGNVLLHLIYE